ncbi:MAG: diguanylate cyclase [Rhizobiales bacterium]|nr:diguanylate cyclase [Hyphomicrobiales bacterium]
MYELRPVTGEFADRRTERAFRASILPEVQRSTRLTLTVAGLVTAFFIISDFSFVGFGWPFYPALLAMRLVVIATCLVLAVVLSRSEALLDHAWVYSVTPFVVATGVFAVAALRPQTLPTQITAVAVVILAIYLFAPNVMRGMFASSGYLSLGFLFSAWYFADAAPAILISIAILLMLSNVVGYFAARRIARLQRQQFALLLDERRSKERLLEEVARREALEQQLRDLAETDGLTRLSNRRHFLEEAAATLVTAQASGVPFSLCMIDLDDFKAINDGWGHGIGDAVLVAVAGTCARVFGSDVPLARFGGEEFVVALPGLDLAAAAAAAERLRTEVAGLRLEGGPPALRVTITVGVAMARAGETQLALVIARADAALYEGKRRGRDTVVADGG